MKYRLGMLLIRLAIGPPALSGLRWWHLDWLPGHKAEVAWKIQTGERLPLIHWLIPAGRRGRQDCSAAIR
jgi:hypothetical protein